MSIDTLLGGNHLRQSGFSLIEVVVFIVIVSVGVVGLMSVMNTTVKHSADPMLRKQAIAVAESLMEEITLKDFNDPDGVAETARKDYDDVGDYNGFSMTGITDVYGNAIAGLTGYQASVTVDKTTATLGGIAAGSVALIAVTVSNPSGESVTLQSYRSNYAP